MLDPDAMRQMAGAMAMAAELAVTVTLGVLAGSWLDSRFGTSPILLLLLALLGLVIGFVRMARTLKSDSGNGGPQE